MVTETVHVHACAKAAVLGHTITDGDTVTHLQFAQIEQTGTGNSSVLGNPFCDRWNSRLLSAELGSRRRNREEKKDRHKKDSDHDFICKNA